jgi:DNA-directed RNA polymerase subunit RPC12/RpoP
MPKPFSKHRIETSPRLHCPRCGSRLVQPLGIDQYGTERWRLDLRCPECDWAGSHIFTTHEIEAIEEELDRGCDELIGQLAEMVRTNMSDYVDRFVAALGTDAIQPMDF